MRTIISFLVLFITGTVSAQVPYGEWELDTANLAIELDSTADELVQPPPPGQRFTAEATAKLNAMRAASEAAWNAAQMEVGTVYEDIPIVPPGQANVFGRNQYYLAMQVDVEGLAQISGLCEGPNDSLWCNTDQNENGYLHEITTTGQRLRSININGSNFDPEDLAYVGEVSPGVGRWALASAGGNVGLFIFDFPIDAPDGYTINLDDAWYHPSIGGSEAMAYDQATKKFHMRWGNVYKVVEFDATTETFTETDGDWDLTQLSGGLKQSCKGMSILGPSMFVVRPNPSGPPFEIQEADISTPGLSAYERLQTPFTNLLAPIAGDDKSIWQPKFEGGPVWALTGDPEQGFYLVAEPFWYQDQKSYQLRYYQRIE